MLAFAASYCSRSPAMESGSSLVSSLKCKVLLWAPGLASHCALSWSLSRTGNPKEEGLGFARTRGKRGISRADSCDARCHYIKTPRPDSCEALPRNTAAALRHPLKPSTQPRAMSIHQPRRRIIAAHHSASLDELCGAAISRGSKVPRQRLYASLRCRRCGEQPLAGRYLGHHRSLHAVPVASDRQPRILDVAAAPQDQWAFAIDRRRRAPRGKMDMLNG
jgi:hypothetical protein